MIDNVLAGVMAAGLRGFQWILWSGPYLLAGLVLAAMARGLLGGSATRRLMGEGRWSGPLRGWLIGILTPVSAVGVLPILGELRRARVRPGSLAAFAISAGAFHPLALAYGLSSLGPRGLGVLLAASLVASLGVGWLISALRLVPEAGEPQWEGRPAPGPGRLKAMGVEAARMMTGPLAIDLAIGLAGAAVLGILLSPEFLPPLLSARNPWAVAPAALVGLPAEVTPERAMMAVVEMRKLGMSSGAMFVWVVLGAGLGLGHASWAVRTLGWKRGLAVGATIVAVLLAVGVALDSFVPASGAEDPDTHVLDEYANPFHFTSANLGTAASVGRKILENSMPGWPVALIGLTACVVAGIVLRQWYPRVTFESYIVEDPPEAAAAPGSMFGAVIPGRVLGAMAVVGLIGLLLVAALAYFPPPDQVLADLTVTHADLYSSIRNEPASATLGHIDLMDRLVARLPVGSLLWRGRVSTEARQKTEVLRRELAELRKAVSAGKRDEAKEIGNRVQDAYRQCRIAFAPGGS